MNLKEIKDLINLMNDNQLTEIEVDQEGSRIKLKKGHEGVTAEGPMPVAALPAAAATPAAASPEAPPSNVQTIKSPMVGTFYAAPAPDADPFVKVGAKVEVGQVVCIVEAMKLMNEVKSEIKGTISEIHIQNGEPVEFGQVLFSVTP